ncbi:GNAT family N-acetyltransferase [Hazenella coriacea]|uniref:Acetyltransferase (GNAT) family protein n=1 Tax=Hazenella coriacea TaxID=1179467 RepID=A0A4R3L2D2_9BACL|nr:GNAT family N-acetyltransferase [Hazenella coriacea]TCS93609.1 acetyltransferase (GNAT) family protein [Hazenella coriacea]
MKELQIRRLKENEIPPKSLLMLADPSPIMINSYLHRGICFVAEKERETVGCYVLLETRPQTVELVNIAVSEVDQGRGMGKKLVLHAIETARSMGCRTIEIGTGNSSLAPLALYQKCGFRIVGVEPDFFVHHYDEEIMENGIPCRDLIRLAKKL